MKDDNEPVAAKKAQAPDPEKVKADLEAKEAAELAAWKASVVGRWVTEHLDVLQDRTGGRHRKV